MNTNSRFVLKPTFNNLSEQWLQYQDILTYITIRSFHNSEDKYCYPSYETIKKTSGFSKKFIARSLKRLSKAGYIQLWKVGRNRVQHYYRFPENQQLIKVPFDLFSIEDLTCNQKAMLLLIHEFCDSLLNCELSYSEIAFKCGLSVITVNNLIRILMDKGYLTYELYEDPLTDSATRHLKLTNKIKWPVQVVPSTASLQADVAKLPDGMEIVNMVLKMVSDSYKLNRKKYK